MKSKQEPLKFDDDIYNTIRHNIKKYRKEKKLTAAELAEQVGRSHDFIRQIESEKTGYNWVNPKFCVNSICGSNRAK